MRANKLADDYSSFTDLRFHLGYGNLYSKAAKDLDEPFTVVEDLTKELLGDLVRRRALKVTKECTALTEQSCGKGSGRAVHDHRELTKELHSDSSRADIKVKQVEEDAVFEAALSFLDEFATDTAIAEDSLAEGGEHPAKSNEEASNAADK
ncbi:hypothetical protein PC129_g4245 [Phytophthora cactorum]|uniref:Uncharacterized protein n=1 Tax=Phytophthora cactorum TaxID=29920 RepID=A0A8T1IIH1_9STRA|nr:hypothetical protein PC129_g4245 [Phytophthora cactorum]